MLNYWGNNAIDVEVCRNIGKYLTKLETFCASIYININADGDAMTEGMTTIIASRLRQLKALHIYNPTSVNRVSLRFKQMLSNADIRIWCWYMILHILRNVTDARKISLFAFVE
jgi:hypothetical protein